MTIKQVFDSHVERWANGPSGIRLHPGLPGGGRGRAGHPTQYPHRPRAQGRPHLHRRRLGPEHAPPRMDDAPGGAPTRRRRRGPADRPAGPEPLGGLRTIEELHAQGIHIRALAEGLDTGDGSPTARLILHMLLSLAEWERETIRDRIKASVDRAAAEGRTGGRPPALDFEKIQAVRDFLATNNGNVSAAHRTFKVSRAVIRAVRDGTYKGLDTLHQNNA